MTDVIRKSLIGLVISMNIMMEVVDLKGVQKLIFFFPVWSKNDWNVVEHTNPPSTKKKKNKKKINKSQIASSPIPAPHSSCSKESEPASL